MKVQKIHNKVVDINTNISMIVLSVIMAVELNISPPVIERAENYQGYRTMMTHGPNAACA
jgi:hypothetical protein